MKVSVNVTGDVHQALTEIIALAGEHAEGRADTQYLLELAAKIHQQMMDDGVEND